MSQTEQRLRKLEHRVDELEETLEIMSDKKLVRSIARGLKDLNEGKYKKYRDAKSLFSDI
ncbi:MAG: hypothetical protein ACHQ1H_03440 [Nitrososphaerales archaeon]